MNKSRKRKARIRKRKAIKHAALLKRYRRELERSSVVPSVARISIGGDNL
jgi:hypothetical protein